MESQIWSAVKNLGGSYRLTDESTGEFIGLFVPLNEAQDKSKMLINAINYHDVLVKICETAYVEFLVNMSDSRRSTLEGHSLLSTMVKVISLATGKPSEEVQQKFEKIAKEIKSKQ